MFFVFAIRPSNKNRCTVISSSIYVCVHTLMHMCFLYICICKCIYFYNICMYIQRWSRGISNQISFDTLPYYCLTINDPYNLDYIVNWHWFSRTIHSIIGRNSDYATELKSRVVGPFTWRKVEKKTFVNQCDGRQWRFPHKLKICETLRLSGI